MLHSSTSPVVLHVRGVTGVGGGPDKTILNSPRFLKQWNYDSLVAFMHPPSDPGFETIRQRAKEAAAPLASVADRGPLDWRVVTELARNMPST